MEEGLWVLVFHGGLFLMFGDVNHVSPNIVLFDIVPFDFTAHVNTQ